MFERVAIWRHLVRPLLPWIGRLVAAILAAVAIGWVAGLILIHRAEPDHDESLPPGVPGRMVTVGGLPVHVVEAGRGEAVILVHGFAGSTFDWEPDVMPALARRWHVVAIDLLGMGFSARAADLAYGYDLWSRQVVGVMDALGIARASLVGHSLGGAVTAIVAGEHADRVAKLALVAPLVPLEQSERAWFFKLAEIPGVGEAMLGWVDHLPALPGFSDAYVARARAIFRRSGTRGALLTYLRHGRDTPRLLAAYPGIRAPALVVHGTADDTVPYAAVRRAAPAIRDALVLPIGNAGHWLMRDEPKRIVEALEQFLAGDVPGAPLPED
jgi:2-hydroxy-6-oxo-octa-2,4-dienoate hydrolase